jgi:phosphopantothenoylcysteine decarboxylase/phosphopantothenate--cysteine ligase
MWRHAAVQAHVATLEARGAVVVPPGEGDLACGETGPGRMAEPAAIVAAVRARLPAADSRWLARRVLVTSGPTLEDVDLVRYVGNRSSGRMGHALAAAAARRGAEVVLVSGPTTLADPPGCRVCRVRSAEDMAVAVERELPGCAAAFFAAAVADFRPERAEGGKLRREGRDRLTLELVRTRDVLAEAVAAATGAVLVGFAAEAGDAVAAARAKLARKGCDAVVANRIDGPDPAFDGPTNEVTVIVRGGRELALPRAAKEEVAERLLDEVASLLPGSTGGAGSTEGAGSA